jgi:hypothetical protein
MKTDMSKTKPRKGVATSINGTSGMNLPIDTKRKHSNTPPNKMTNIPLR